MTRRERSLLALLALTAGASLLAVNWIEALAGRDSVLALRERYEAGAASSGSIARTIGRKRALLESIKSGGLASSIERIEPLRLSEAVRRLLEESGAEIKSYAIGGTAENPRVDFSVSIGAAGIASFLSAQERDSSRLRIEYLSLRAGSGGTLTCMVRVTNADGL